MSKICTYSETPIKQPIGNSRKNGKQHDNWEGRTLHKQCFKKQQKYEEIQQEYQRMTEKFERLEQMKKRNKY